jgi:hypothetical protein
MIGTHGREHTSTEQQFGGSTDWAVSLTKMNPQAPPRDLVFGAFQTNIIHPDAVMDVIRHVCGTRRMAWSVQYISKYLMATMKTSLRKLEPERPVPQEQKSQLVPLESLEDIAWELWLLIELLAPVRRRLPNTASQKLVDYVLLGHPIRPVWIVISMKERPKSSIRLNAMTAYGHESVSLEQHWDITAALEALDGTLLMRRPGENSIRSQYALTRTCWSSSSAPVAGGRAG